MHPSDVLCFAQRILNPFRGAMHTVRMQWADAVTTDGRNWTLYVRGERFYDDLQEPDNNNISVPDIKFGTWSREQGFERAPIRLPTFDPIVRHEGERLLAAVQQCAEQIPFPYQDHHELWLLHHASGRPLALLASHCDHQPAEAPPLLRWTPGQAAIAFDPSLQRLRERVTALAGKAPAAAWFDRRNQRLPQQQLDTQAMADFERELRSLHQWLAPCELLLRMDDASRSATEQLARRHALRLVELLALYPKVIEQELITAAQVEVRMRKANATAAGSGEEEYDMSPFYLEL